MEASRFSTGPQSINTLTSASSSLSESYLGALDIVIFCMVLLLSVSAGLIHTYLINRRSSQKFSDLSESSHQNNDSRELSRRASDADNGGYNTIDSVGREKNRRTESSEFDKTEDMRTEDRSLANNQHVGLALISDSTYGNTPGNTDIMFHLVCYASIIITLGLPAYTCYHGASLAISFLPAMLAAHITAIGIVNPLLKAYHNKHFSRYTDEKRKAGSCKGYEESVSLLSYLWKRFGGCKGKQSQLIKIAEHADRPQKLWVVILIMITTTLVLILWIIFTVSIQMIAF